VTYLATKYMICVWPVSLLRDTVNS
jgi:hypothetical protein